MTRQLKTRRLIDLAAWRLIDQAFVRHWLAYQKRAQRLAACATEHMQRCVGARVTNAEADCNGDVFFNMPLTMVDVRVSPRSSGRTQR